MCKNINTVLQRFLRVPWQLFIERCIIRMVKHYFMQILLKK
jgi:hypothetical protein